MTAIVDLEQVPAQMAREHRWVLWRTETRDGKPTKVPYRADAPGRRASATDPGTWASFEDALEARHRADGIGFVLGDGFLGIDLDDCVNDDRLHPAADQIVKRCSSYAEWSPNNGVHIVMRGQWSGRNRAVGPWGGKFEIYDHDRFFTVTGDQLDRTPGAVTNSRQRQIDAICQEIFEYDEDEKLLRRVARAAGQSFEALFHDGDWSGYESESEADLALCNFFARHTRDPARIERLFRRSALADDKWEREDYRARTIEKALTREHGDFDEEVARELLRIRTRKEAERLYKAEQARHLRVVEFPPLDRTGADDLAEPVAPVKYAIERLHVDGGNVVLVAQYKIGKTTFVLNLQRSLTDDEYFLDEFDIKPLEGTVAFFNYELTANMRREWMQEMNFKHPERLVPPFDIRGVRAPFWDDEYRKRLTDYLAAKDAEWWFLDTAQRASSGFVTDWNSNDHVDEFCALLDEMKSEAGITNLVLTHHQGRQMFGKDEERARGATRLEDWGDSLWYLTKVEGRRSLRAAGRDVDLEAIDLEYDERDRAYYHTGLTRDERSDEEGVRKLISVLASLNDDEQFPGTENFKKAVGGNRNQVHKHFTQALDDGYISRDRDPKSGSLRCAVTDEGRQLLRTRVIR